MSVLDQLDPRELARRLRDPSGDPGVAVADALPSSNRAGNACAVADLRLVEGDLVLEVG